MKRKQAGRRWMVISMVACILSLIVMGIALAKEPEHETGPFVPPAFDKNAVVGTPAVPDGLGWSELDAQVFQAWLCGKVTIYGEQAEVWLMNPDGNTVWLKLRIMDGEENVLGESGLLRPGEYVQAVTLDAVPENGAAIKLKLMAYEPDSYYSEGSATINTTVKVTEEK